MKRNPYSIKVKRIPNGYEIWERLPETGNIFRQKFYGYGRMEALNRFHHARQKELESIFFNQIGS